MAARLPRSCRPETPISTAWSGGGCAGIPEPCSSLKINAATTCFIGGPREGGGGGGGGPSLTTESFSSCLPTREAQCSTSLAILIAKRSGEVAVDVQFADYSSANKDGNNNL